MTVIKSVTADQSQNQSSEADERRCTLSTSSESNDANLVLAKVCLGSDARLILTRTRIHTHDFILLHK